MTPPPQLTCRPDENGVPACPRASKCSSIEIRGKSLLDLSIHRSHGNRDDPIIFPEDCDILIICESLDKKDDWNGFFGHARMFEKLIELIAKAEIDSSRVWISPLVRCYTNKKPTVTEINKCAPLLAQEIEQVNPKSILLLGTLALRAFRLHNMGGLTYIRGEVYNIPIPNRDIDKTYHVIPTNDPNIFYRQDSPQLEARILSDYKKALLIADGKPIGDQSQLAKYTLIDSIDKLKDLISEIKSQKLFAFDTEYPSVPAYRHPLICISFSLGVGRNWVLPIKQHDSDGLDYKLKPYWEKIILDEIIFLLKSVFEDREIAKGGHNIKGDCIVLRRWLDIKVRGFLYDSMLMHHLLHEYKPHKLEFLADAEFGVGDYSKELHDIIGYGAKLKATYDNVLDDMLWMYAAMDAECTWRLVELYHRRLQEKPHLWQLYLEETEPASHAYLKAEWFGHAIDMKTHAVLVTEYEQLSENLLADIRAETWPDFNPNSPPQCIKAIISAGFSESIKDYHTVSGYSTGKDKLMDIQRDLPLAKWIIDYRNATKMLGTYLKVIEEDIDVDGRIRPSFWIPGTESGRISCRLFHQIPRVDKKRKHNIKDIFSSRDGYTLVYFDLSQVELRMIAILANDIKMLEIFYPDGLDKPNLKADLHSETAAVILNCDVENVSEFNRQEIGKPTNFGVAYGSEGHTLVKKGRWEDAKGNIHAVTWKMLTPGMERFKENYAGLTIYLEDVPNITRAQGNIYCTPFGRERRMGGKLDDPVEGIRKAAEREIVNFTIQSPAGALTVRIIITIDQLLDGFIDGGQLEEDDIYLVNNVHDSATWEVKDRLVDWFKDTLKEIIHRPVLQLAGAVFPGDIGTGNTETEAEKSSHG